MVVGKRLAMELVPRLRTGWAAARSCRMASSGRENPLLRERGDVSSGRNALVQPGTSANSRSRVQPPHTSRLAVVLVGFTLTRGPVAPDYVPGTRRERL